MYLKRDPFASAAKQLQLVIEKQLPPDTIIKPAQDQRVIGIVPSLHNKSANKHETRGSCSSFMAFANAPFRSEKELRAQTSSAADSLRK